MDYPLYIDGTERGRLRVYPEGLLTCFDAESEDTGKLIRLYIYGESRKYCLGTMKPEQGRLRLIKKLSRSEMRELPEKLLYASNSELSEKHDDALLWTQSPSGILYGFDGERSLTALPWSSWKKPRGAVLRQINGRDYIVFYGKRNSGINTDNML